MLERAGTRRGRAALVAIGALVVVQLGAVAIYRAVEGRRGPGAAPFAVEALEGDAPDLTLTRRDGRTTRLRDHRGRPVLLHFWATWCPPCVDELPGLLAAAREREGELLLLAVSLDEDWDAVERFFGGAVPAEVWRPADRVGHRRYGVAELPETFWIGSEGRLRARYGGARDWSSAAARAHLRGALQSGPTGR